MGHDSPRRRRGAIAALLFALGMLAAAQAVSGSAWPVGGGTPASAAPASTAPSTSPVVTAAAFHPSQSTGAPGPRSVLTGARPKPSTPPSPRVPPRVPTAPPGTDFPIAFVTQVPFPWDYLTVASTFGNHLGRPRAAPRGGDLWIRYPDGTLKNLTAAAGFGNAGLQGANSIVVREPSPSFDGTRLVFSMIHGAPGLGNGQEWYWQLYECTGLGPNDPVLITKVPFQPADANNTSPTYASDGRILFTSDRPRGGEPHLYPQLDEYEEAPTNTGVWSLDPSTGDLRLFDHTPSGAFKPFVDSSGRVVYTRWDHLERDQQTDLEYMGLGNYGTFNYSDEGPNAVQTTSKAEVFPEPRSQWIDYVNQNPGYSGPLNGWQPHLVGHLMNTFLPWEMNQDGTGVETLGHVGRHELFDFVDRNRNDDPSILNHVLFLSQTIQNDEPITNLFQMREDPRSPGSYLGVDARIFDTHSAGQIVRLDAPAGTSANQFDVTYVTHRSTQAPTLTPGPEHSGFYRGPVPLSDGRLVASHTPETRKDANEGTAAAPISRYDFRLKEIVPSGAYFEAGSPLTPGLSKSVQWYDPWSLVTHEGELWELDAVEVRPRAVPGASTVAVESPEQQVLASKGVTVASLRNWLRANDLALLVVRDVTTRDENDQQQPYNLRVAGSSHETIANGGTVYGVRYWQVFQGDQVRGLTMGGPFPVQGRRVLAQPLHETSVWNPDAGPTAPAGSLLVAPDGSAAAVVPARRALSWQLVSPGGEPLVRERYWLTFQPGEVRTCSSCHGLNDADQAGAPESTQAPQAFGALVDHLKNLGVL